MYKISILIFIVVITLVSSRQIPDYIRLCKRNDPSLSQCIINNFNVIRPYLKQGIPELDIPPLESFNNPHVSINNGQGTAVTVDARAWNQTTTGLMDVIVKELQLDFDKVRCSLVLELPYVRIKGNYKFSGKVMMLEIQTNGTYDINATDVTSNTEIYGKFITINGKEYIEFEKIEVRLDFKKCVMYVSNLINGNEVLTQTLNAAVNENIHTVFEDLSPVIEETLGDFARQFCNGFFRLFSVDELFPTV